MYGPSGRYVASGVVQTLVRLLGVPRYYLEAARVLSILCAAEHLGDREATETALDGSISLLMKNLLLLPPLERTDSSESDHVTAYSYALRVLASKSRRLRARLQSLLSSFAHWEEAEADALAHAEAAHLLRWCRAVRQAPSALHEISAACDQEISDLGLVWCS